MEYLKVASVSLSLVRAFECAVLGEKEFKRPVLDVGCGDGLFTKMLFDDAIDFGIDTSAREIALAKKSGNYLNLSVNWANSMPFPENYFRSVFSNCVVEHIDPIEESFKEICRVLQPGGEFYCTTHSDHYEEYFFYSTILRKLGFDNLAKKYSGFWRSLWNHYNCCTAERWIKLLKDAGFSQAKATPYLNRKAVYIFDIFLPAAVPTYYMKKLIGRWKYFPRIFSLYPAGFLLRKVIEKNIKGDWCYLLEAVK